MPYTTDGVPFQSHSDTSRDAAIRAAAFVGDQGMRVRHFIVWCGSRGATQKEIAAALTIARSSVAARVNALEQAGEVVKSTARRDGCAAYIAKEQS